MKVLLPFLMVIFSACKSNDFASKEEQKNTISSSISSSPISESKVTNCNYEVIKKRCKELLITQPVAHSQYIVDSLLPCWYGTQWDFNGCSTKPKEGKIACGYFVTTILQDAGLSINRVKMAICPSSVLIKNTCTQVKIYRNKSIEYFVKEMKLKEQGLYIAGLDQHTGFIYYDGIEVYFIHSSYIFPKLVVKEKAIESPALAGSKIKMIAKVRI